MEPKETSRQPSSVSRRLRERHDLPPDQGGGGAPRMLLGALQPARCSTVKDFKCSCEMSARERTNRTCFPEKRGIIKKLISEFAWKLRDEFFKVFDRIISTCGLL